MLQIPTQTSATLDSCAACGAPLTTSYYAIEQRPERFCAGCMHSRPRCSGCGSPVGAQHWQLHDSRVLCARCHPMAVYDSATAQQLYEATVQAVVAQLGLTLRVGVAFRLVDVPTIATMREQSGHPVEAQILGLYQRSGVLRVIYVLYGLPKLAFRATVAHEYAHAWQTENCPLLEDDVLREGFAEWVAYHHLLALGCTKAAQQMLSSNHPYRPMLESVLALEHQRGVRGVIDHILAVGRGAA